MTRVQHMSDGFYENDEGWYTARCTCGAKLGVCPDAETAADALMNHAYLVGLSDGWES